jgi:predicted deacylase
MDDATAYAVPLDPDVPLAPARVVHRLEIASFDVGVERTFVELVGDGLATGVRVPVLVARGAHPGPVVGLTACLHGNEVNGIPVIHELFRELDVQKLHGTVVGVIAANVPGLHRNQREFLDGTDLNRIFPGRPDGNVAQVYAHRLLHRIVDQFEMLVDLHTASFGRINSLYVRADLEDERTATMADLQHPQIIVHNPASDHTLRGAAMEMGIPAITVEIGDPQRWQKGYTVGALAGVRRVLHWANVLPHVPEVRTAEPVICSSSGWMYTDRGGLLQVFPQLLEVVKAGQRVATVSNAFGDPIREYRAPFDGIVVGKSTNPIGHTGARIVHLGKIADPGQFPHAERS